MRISLILPTNRTSNVALARILEWSSLPAEKFELIVHDNSENLEKIDFLSKIKSNCLKLFIIPTCPPFENIIKAVSHAQGEYILPLADDDTLSLKGLYSLHATADALGKDDSVSCLTGDYLIESGGGSGLFRYTALDQENPDERITQYLNNNTSNLLYYSAAKSQLSKLGYNFLQKLPYRLSYHDQLISLIYLKGGKIKQINRVVYGYDVSEWETTEKRLGKDRSMYVAAGLPPEFSKLHHLFCGVEGSLLLDSSMLHEFGCQESSSASDQWLGTMLYKFKADERGMKEIDSEADRSISMLCQKIKKNNEFNVNDLLMDICDCLEAHSAIDAQRYFEFWSEL